MTNLKFYILAGSKEYTPSVYTEKGSNFCSNLCTTLLFLFENEQEITLGAITEKIEKDFSKETMVYYKKGERDFKFIYENNSRKLFFDDCLMQIKKQFHKTNDTLKEALIYSCDFFPASLKIKLLYSIFKDIEVEANWLVRRALASLLETCDFVDSSKKNITQQLISSRSWMAQCVGLLSFKANPDGCRENILNILKSPNPNPDLAWISTLLYIDLCEPDLSFLKDSFLAKSDWGILNIYVTAKRKEKLLISRYFIDLSKKSKHKKFLLLKKHLQLEKQTIHKNKLIDLLFKSSERGTSRKSFVSKWFFSKLFGDWGGTISFDLREYFDNETEYVIQNELAELSNLPSIEMKMAIFQYFQLYPEFIKHYKDFVLWGITDQHPWVIREAIKVLFKEINESHFKHILSLRFDLYPGKLDLLLTLIDLKLYNHEYFKSLLTTKNEEKAIRRYLLYCEF